ncbi:MAG TPA: hypothetical protein VLD13_10340 [Gaiellaceae bacterium]|nr:hypothetical protein [Gaiellaceae bacterium]
MDGLDDQRSAPLGREDGQGATEYGIVIAVVLLSLTLTIGVLAASITTFLNSIAGLVDLLLP